MKRLVGWGSLLRLLRVFLADEACVSGFWERDKWLQKGFAGFLL